MCKWAGMERPCHVHARRLVPHESAEAGVVGHPCLQGWEIQQTPRSAADALPCGVQRKGQPSPRVASTGRGYVGPRRLATRYGCELAQPAAVRRPADSRVAAVSRCEAEGAEHRHQPGRGRTCCFAWVKRRAGACSQDMCQPPGKPEPLAIVRGQQEASGCASCVCPSPM